MLWCEIDRKHVALVAVKLIDVEISVASRHMGRQSKWIRQYYQRTCRENGMIWARFDAYTALLSDQNEIILLTFRFNHSFCHVCIIKWMSGRVKLGELLLFLTIRNKWVGEWMSKRVSHSLTLPLTLSLTHPLTHSLTHSNSLIHAFAHSVSQSVPTHWLSDHCSQRRVARLSSL